QEPAWNAPSFASRPRRPHRRSDRQDFGAIQSSQNGPHLLQPPSETPKAIKPTTIARIRNMAHQLPHPHNTASHRGISSRREAGFLLENAPSTVGNINSRQRWFMAQQS